MKKGGGESNEIIISVWAIHLKSQADAEIRWQLDEPMLFFPHVSLPLPFKSDCGIKCASLTTKAERWRETSCHDGSCNGISMGQSAWGWWKGITLRVKELWLLCAALQPLIRLWPQQIWLVWLAVLGTTCELCGFKPKCELEPFSPGYSHSHIGVGKPLCLSVHHGPSIISALLHSH